MRMLILTHNIHKFVSFMFLFFRLFFISSDALFVVCTLNNKKKAFNASNLRPKAFILNAAAIILHRHMQTRQTQNDEFRFILIRKI